MTSNSLFQLCLCFMLFLVHQSIGANDFKMTIYSEQWDIPRHGEMLIKQPELGKLVRMWSLHPESQIHIRYPGGEEGEVWVHELMDWLVALGVPSEVMLNSPGSGGEDIISLVLNANQVKGKLIDE